MSTRQNKILIVDDDQEFCEEMAEILKDKRYYVSVAFDGSKGKGLIEKYNYDVVLLDLKIPGLSGFDILKNIKEIKATPKVIILTGRPLAGELKETNYEEEKDILKLADAIINKPFNVEILLGKIKELLDKA